MSEVKRYDFTFGYRYDNDSRPSSWAEESDAGEFVLAADYDALAVELARWQKGSAIRDQALVDAHALIQEQANCFIELEISQRRLAELEGALHDCRGPVNFDLERKVVEQPQAAREALSVENQRITPVAPLLAPEHPLARAATHSEDGREVPELKLCPFCGGKCDPMGWMNIYGEQGPECEDCGATGPNADAWNIRAALAPAAIAVVMPARMTTIPEGKTISYAAGYEYALDAVTNLNRNTVPLELLERMINFVDRNTHYQFGEPLTSFDAEGGRLENELRAILGAKP